MDVNTIKRYFGINVNGGDVHASWLAVINTDYGYDS